MRYILKGNFRGGGGGGEREEYVVIGVCVNVETNVAERAKGLICYINDFNLIIIIIIMIMIVMIHSLVNGLKNYAKDSILCCRVFQQK